MISTDDRWKQQQVNFVLLARRDFTPDSSSIFVWTYIHEVLWLSRQIIISIQVVRVAVLQIVGTLGDRPEHAILILSVISLLFSLLSAKFVISLDGVALLADTVWETAFALFRGAATWKTTLTL